VDWLNGSSREVVDEVRLMLVDKTAVLEPFRVGGKQLLVTSPSGLAEKMQASRSRTDLDVLMEEAACMQQACAPGIEGGWETA
jgi:hypothetical protein